jgi:hypothetical protein
MTLKNRATRIKNTVLLIFVILFVQLFPLEAEGQTSSDVFPLKVMTFNIRFGELASLEELAAFIKSQYPDIVAPQEVDVRTFRERASHQNGKDLLRN